MTKEELEEYARSVGATVSEFWGRIGSIDVLYISATSHDGFAYRTLRAYTPAEAAEHRQFVKDCLSMRLGWKPFVQKPRAGINNAARVECKKSRHHGFHPSDERCPLCG